MTDANLVRVLQAQSRGQVGLVRREDVARGPETIRERFAQLRADGVRLAVFDAIDNDDLIAIGAACADLPLDTLFGQEVIIMKMNEDIRPVTYLKSRTADLLSQISKTRRPVIITQNGEARAVLQDPESYEQLIAAIGLLKLLTQGEKDVRKGKTISQDDVFTQLEHKLASLKKSSES